MTKPSTKKIKLPSVALSSVVFAALVSSGLLSTSAWATDLLQTYQEALQNDPQFASARASLTAGQEKSVQGRAGLLPRLNLTGNNTMNRTKDTVGDTELNLGRGFSSNYALQLTQPLVHWENWQQYEQSKLLVLTSEAQFSQAKLDLMVRVSQAYFDVLYAQDTLDAQRANKTAISEQLAIAKRNFEVGTTTITDQHEAQSRFDLAVAQEIAAENDLEIKRTALQQIIGHVPNSLTPLNKKVQLSAPQPSSMTDWVSAAEINNYSVVEAQVNQEIAKRTISINRAGHLPTVDLVANVNRSSSSASPVFNQPAFLQNQNSIGIQVNVPLFSGFSVTSKVREAIALEDKAGNDYEAAKRSAAFSARQAFVGVNSGLAQVKAYEAAEISSQSALDSNVLGYQVGVRINIDVLNAQQQLYTTQQNLAKARYDTIMNGLRLKAAAASLSEEDLAKVNALLY